MTKRDVPVSVLWEFIVPFKEGVPWIKKQKIDLRNKKFVLVNEISRISLRERENYILLFYAEERHFNAFYTEFESRVEVLRNFYAVCSLDFSTFPGIDNDENRVAIKKNCLVNILFWICLNRHNFIV